MLIEVYRYIDIDIDIDMCIYIYIHICVTLITLASREAAAVVQDAPHHGAALPPRR